MREWPPTDQDVIVSDVSFVSENAHDIIGSNTDFINALLAECVHKNEIARDAMRSYYVDYYLAQVNNGGFSQFVYNTNWSPTVVEMVREGLSAMKAAEHLKLLDEIAAIVDQMDAESLQAFLGGWYGDSPDVLAGFDAADNGRFGALEEIEDLTACNAAWLRSLPNLQVRTDAELHAEVRRRAAALPDIEERRLKRLENEPRFVKLIRALSVNAGHEFQRVNAGDPSHRHNGEIAMAWHFLTDRGHHYMVEFDGKAIMFDGTTKKPVFDMDAS